MATEDLIPYLDLVKAATHQAAEHGITPGSIGGAVSRAALTEAAEWAAKKPLVRVNRARAAALVDYGYQTMDWYDLWRPYIFVGAAGFFLASLGALAYRRKTAEAWPLYLVAAGSSGTLAWFTRPMIMRRAPAPLPTKDPSSPSSLNYAVGWLDDRVKTKSRIDPGWEARTWQRVAQDLGWSTMPSYAREFFTTHTR